MSCTLCAISYWIVGVVVFILAWGWWFNGYFRRRGVKSPPAYFPLIGNTSNALFQKQHFKDFVHDLYNLCSDKYIGILQLIKPFLVVRDIELIKNIAVKDFDHFTDRGGGVSEDADVIFGNSLLSLKGQKWRDMRATLSPAFTTSKMRGMFQLILDCSEQTTDYYINETNSSINRVRGVLEVEMKDAFTRYANDVIATTAFGITVDSFKEKDNQFYLMGIDCTDFSGGRFAKLLLLSVMPKLAKTFGIQVFSKKITNFFRHLVWDTIKDREDHHIIRQDMIQLLMEARKGTLKHEDNDDGKEAGFATVEESAVGKTTVNRVWKDDEIVAQAMLFFIAGFDTSSSVLCFVAHELTINPNIQKRLQQEIDEVAASTDGKLTYDCLQKMKYLDMVISETLRKWPPSVILDRKCVKSYTLPPPNEQSSQQYQLEAGDSLWIPVYGIHHDPQFFKNPESFDPERFSDENKHNIINGTYLPFGLGPRNCIGSRFALVEVKAIIYNLLLKFDFITTAKTQNPIKMNLKTFSMHSERGFWVGLRPRFKRLPSNQF